MLQQDFNFAGPGGAPRRAWQEFGGRFGLGLEPLRGTRLRVGIAVHGVSGDDAATLVAPEVSLDQRLKGGYGVFASFKPSLELARLGGTRFDQELALPSTSLRPQRDSLNLRGGLRALPREGFSLEAAGFHRETEDAIQADDPLQTRVWTLVNTGRLASTGAELKAEAALPLALSATVQARYEYARNLDSPDRKVTFAPEWSGRAGVDGRWAAFTGSLGLVVLGPRWARQNATDAMDPAFDLQARLGYDVKDTLTLFAEGRNLLNQPVAAWEGYPEARPWLGLGATLRFK